MEARQQDGVKVQSRIEMSWQTGLGVLFGACPVAPMVENIAGQDQVVDPTLQPLLQAKRLLMCCREQTWVTSFSVLIPPSTSSLGLRFAAYWLLPAYSLHGFPCY